MSIITEYVKIIKTAEGKELFKLPIDTLLDRIIPDLWNDMARYRFNYQFIFCDRLNPLGGFRAVKKDEFVSVKSIFSGYYYENKGINIEIKNIEERRAFGAEIYVIIDEYYASYSNGECILCDTMENNSKIIFRRDIIENGFTVNGTKVNKLSTNIHLVLMIRDQ
jgi:hypothetical protein